MKIGIMSMQRVENYGSYLQAYALKKTLENMGNTVEFVDYLPEAPVAQAAKKQQSGISRSMLRRVLNMLSPSYRAWRRMQIYSNRTFATFARTYREQWLPMLGVPAHPNYLPQLDVLVIGSDEVFNCTQEERQIGFSRQLFGKDNHAKRLISYAASFGSTSLKKIEEYQIEKELASLLKNFERISVRDENSAQLVRTLVGCKAPIHIDPVLLYPFPEIKQYEITMKDYIIVYAYAGRLTQDEIQGIKCFAQKKGKKLVSLGFWQSFCDDYVLASPLEVLAYIGHADYVLTDTFHGTVFSMVNQVPFGTFIRESNQQKLSSLLRQFGLEDREIKNPMDLDRFFQKPIDYEALQRKLQKERTAAMTYLYSSLDGIEPN